LVSSSGTLKAAVADDTIASVSVDSNTKVLSITGLKSGNTTITVSYVDGSGNKLCSDLEIDLYVTAELQIVSGATPQLFTNETALIPLYIRDKNGNALDSSLLSQITFTQCGPVIADSNTYFSQISGSGNQYIDNSNDIFSLKMNTKKATGTTSVTMQYTFTYNQIQYTATNPITIEVVAAPTVEAATQIMELKNNSTMTQVFNNDAITVLLNGERLTDVTITKAEVYVGDIIYPELRDGTLSFTATWSSDANDGEGTNILLTLQVKTSDGVVHNQTLNLVVQVFKTTAADFEKDHPADDATDDPSDEQELTP
jgi:hypothetical protein